MRDENGDPLGSTAKAEQLVIWSNADYYMDLNQMKLKITLHLPYQDENGNMTTIEQYVPSMYSANYIPLLLKVYHASEQPAGPEAPEQSESPVRSLVKRIVSFFLRIVDFFKRMFNIAQA